MISKLSNAVRLDSGSAGFFHGTLLYVVFIIGVICGSISGVVFSSPLMGGDISSLMQGGNLYSGVLQAFIGNARFFFLLLLFSTCYLGIVFIPVVVFVKAYVFSCSVASMYALYSFTGLGCSLFISALPGVIVFPCFLLLAANCALASIRLFRSRFYAAPYQAVSGAFRSVVICFILVLALSIYDYYALPVLLSKLFL